MPDIIDAAAELPGSAQKNLPAVVNPPTWVAEKVVTFVGKGGRSTTVIIPAHMSADPFPKGFAAEFESAFRTRDGLLVWDLLTKAGVE